MSDKKTTAGKTAEAAQEPITYEQTDGKITVTISGEAFANLQAVADAMNATGWCDSDNTAVHVLRLWCGSFIDRTAFKAGGDGLGDTIEDVANDILAGIDTDEEEGSDADNAKLDALRAQFVKHGVLRPLETRARSIIQGMDTPAQDRLRSLAAKQNTTPVEYVATTLKMLEEV